ncbi:MAG: hypothetical protein ABIF82_15480 [Planctomycetota bacterium]
MKRRTITIVALVLVFARCVAAAQAAEKTPAADEKPAQPPAVKFEAVGLTEPQKLEPGTTAVMVTFENVPYRMIFRPPWLTGFIGEKNIICAPGYAETADAKNCDGPAEVQQDKANRYARMWIEKQSAARIIVRTRAALCDKNGVIAHNDVPSGSPYGNGDWVDERFTIYPDGTHVRVVKIYTGLAEAAAAHWVDGKPPFETQETTIINGDGRPPTDDIDVNALTLIRMNGEAKTIPFKPYPPEGALLKDANIQVVNLETRFKPFTIVPDTDPKIQAFRGPWADHEHLGERVFVGWPSGAKWDKYYTVALSHVIDWRFHERTKNTLTSIYLIGMTDAATDATKAKALVPLARSWLRAPKLTPAGAGTMSAGFEKKERAYVLRALGTAGKRRVGFAIAASEDSPLVDPVFVIRGWDGAAPAVKVNGQAAEAGKNLRIGVERGKAGDDLVIWMKMSSIWPMQFSVE